MHARRVTMVNDGMPALGIHLVSLSWLKVIGPVHEQACLRISPERNMNAEAPVQSLWIGVGCDEVTGHDHRHHRLVPDEPIDVDAHRSFDEIPGLITEAAPIWVVDEGWPHFSEELGLLRPFIEGNIDKPIRQWRYVDPVAKRLTVIGEFHFFFGLAASTGFGCSFLGLPFDSLRCCLLATCFLHRLLSFKRFSLAANQLENSCAGTDNASREEGSAKRIRKVATA